MSGILLQRGFVVMQPGIVVGGEREPDAIDRGASQFVVMQESKPGIKPELAGRLLHCGTCDVPLAYVLGMVTHLTQHAGDGGCAL